jgi:integral membrane protein (TIGR01906 family)
VVNALAVAAIAIVVTPLFVVDAFRVLTHDWFVRHELGSVGFPPDRYGLPQAARLRLALTGLHSIQPRGEGIALLRRATLPDGSPAFDARELRHMQDVRDLLGTAFRAQIAVLLALVVAGIALHRSARWRRVVPLGLLLGSLATLVVAALLIPVILLGFDGFLLRFHEIFFSGDSWRFSETDTLLRIYPEVFWQDTAKLAAGLAVGQAVVVAFASWWWLRRLGRRQALSTEPAS